MTNGGGHAPPPRHAPVMELVDMRDLGSRAETRVGSSPFRRTKTRPLLPKRGWGFVLFSALPPQRRRGPVPLCLEAKERRLRSFENRRSQSGHDHGPPHDGYFFFAAVRQFLSIRSARTPGMGGSVCAGDADRRDRNIWGCIGQKVEQTKRSQMPQAHAVLPQLVLLHRLDDLVQRRRESFPVLWQIPLELKRVRCT